MAGDPIIPTGEMRWLQRRLPPGPVPLGALMTAEYPFITILQQKVLVGAGANEHEEWRDVELVIEPEPERD